MLPSQQKQENKLGLEQLVNHLQKCQMIKQLKIPIPSVTIIAEFSLCESGNGDILIPSNDNDNNINSDKEEAEENSDIEILSNSPIKTIRDMVYLDCKDSDLEILNDNHKHSIVRGRIRNRRRRPKRKSIGRRRTRPKSLINPTRNDNDNDNDNENENENHDDNDDDNEFNLKKMNRARSRRRSSFMLSKKAKITIGTRKTRKRPRGYALGVDDETEADDEAEDDYTISDNRIGNKKRKLQ